MNFFKGDICCNCIYLVLVKMIDLVGSNTFCKIHVFCHYFFKKGGSYHTVPIINAWLGMPSHSVMGRKTDQIMKGHHVGGAMYVIIFSLL